MATKQKKQQRNPANINGTNHTFRVEDAVVNSGSQVRPRWGLSEQELAMLIPLAGKGDEQAQQTLLKAYKALIESKLCLALGRDAYPDALRWGLGQNVNATPDAVAELTNLVFHRMIKGLSGLKLECCFKAWLMTIAERVAYSYLRVLVRYRKNGKLPERGAELAIDDGVNEDWEDQLLPVYQQRSADQHDALIQRLDRERARKRGTCRYLSELDHPLLLQIFKSLPPRYRDVLWDAAVNDLSHDEIAQDHAGLLPQYRAKSSARPGRGSTSCHCLSSRWKSMRKAAPEHSTGIELHSIQGHPLQGYENTLSITLTFSLSKGVLNR